MKSFIQFLTENDASELDNNLAILGKTVRGTQKQTEDEEAMRLSNIRLANPDLADRMKQDPRNHTALHQETEHEDHSENHHGGILPLAHEAAIKVKEAEESGEKIHQLSKFLPKTSSTTPIHSPHIPKPGLLNAAGGKLGLAGIGLGIASGASTEEILHSLHPLSILAGGVANAEPEYNDPKDKDRKMPEYQMPTKTPKDQLPQNSPLRNITKPLSQWNNY